MTVNAHVVTPSGETLWTLFYVRKQAYGRIVNIWILEVAPVVLPGAAYNHADLHVWALKTLIRNIVIRCSPHEACWAIILP